MGAFMIYSDQPVGGNEHILFVDDEPSLVKMGRLILASFGYQVTTQTNSSEALEQIKAQPDRFDLVVTDMTMPKISGDMLAQAITAIRPKLPVILSSGFSTPLDEQKTAAMGIQAYIRKPFLIEQLARINCCNCGVDIKTAMAPVLASRCSISGGEHILNDGIVTSFPIAADCYC